MIKVQRFYVDVTYDPDIADIETIAAIASDVVEGPIMELDGVKNIDWKDGQLIFVSAQKEMTNEIPS